MIYLNLVNNISLLVALSVLHSLIVRRWAKDTRAYQVASGLLFGGTSVVGMWAALNLTKGIIFDGRSIMISIAGLFGGPISAGIAAVMAAAYRAWLGGGGAVMGVSVATESALLGIAWYYLRRRHAWATHPLGLLGFGILVHIIMLALTSTLPADQAAGVFVSIAIPVITMYPVATVLVCMFFLDQEARIEADKALRENEKRLREVQEMARLGYWYWDIKTGDVQWSEEVYKIFRLDPREFTPRIDSILALSPWPEDNARDQELIRKAMESHEKGEYEQRFLRPDKSIGYYYSTFQGCYDEKDQLVAIVGSVMDITERKQAEQGLRDSEERYRSLFEAANDAILLIASDRLIDCNPTTLRMFDCSREQMLAASPQQFSPERQPDGRLSAEKARERFLAAYQGVPQSFEWRYHRMDGTLFDAEVHINRISIAGKAHIIAIIHDVTDRKRAEEALHREMSFSRTLIDSSPTFFVAIESDGRTRMMNPTMLKALGYTAVEVADKDYLTTFVPEPDRESVAATFRKLIEARLPTVSENRVLTKDGLTLLVEWRGVPVFKGEGFDFFFGVGIDVTERKAAEAALSEYRDRLEEMVEQRTAQLAGANNALNEFAYVVSHDLKAPLRAVNQLAQWITEDYTSVLDEEGKKKLGLMNGRLARMHNLIDGILQYSRIGRVEEDRKPIDLSLLVPEVIEALSPPAHIRVTVEGPLPTVTADRTRMEQVFQNLIGNAIKFMDKPEGRITVGCEDAGDRWRFRVADNGPGIDPKYHEKVFGIFQTLAPRDQQESTGIGLALVKKIIEGYAGRIELASGIGTGCIFSFTLPK